MKKFEKFFIIFDFLLYFLNMEKSFFLVFFFFPWYFTGLFGTQ